jgi:pimeloyl-ACP methyl ester carboxylesterase
MRCSTTAGAAWSWMALNTNTASNGSATVSVAASLAWKLRLVRFSSAARLRARSIALSGFVPEVAGHFFPNLAASYDLRPHLSEITVPTLVIVGREDWVCPPVASRILASSIPGAGLVEIADAGHFPFSEEPAAFRHAVTAFLDAQTPADGHKAAGTVQTAAGSIRNTG